MSPKSKNKVVTPAKSRIVLKSSTITSSLDVKKELEILEKAKKKVLSSKKSAFDSLVNNGFLTKHGNLAKRYR